MPTRSLPMYVSRWEVNDVIALYLILAAAVFALGYWQGYVVAESKFKDKKVLKYIHTDCVPICVSKMVNRHELSRMDSEFASKYLENVVDDLRHLLGDEVCKYAKVERMDGPFAEYADSIAFKATVLVRPYKDGD